MKNIVYYICSILAQIYTKWLVIRISDTLCYIFTKPIQVWSFPVAEFFVSQSGLFDCDYTLPWNAYDKYIFITAEKPYIDLW